MAGVTWLSVVLLACAVGVVIGAEWPRLRERLGLEAHRKRQRARRKSQWKLVRGDGGDDDGDGDDAADFAASVERDLDQLPTLDEFDRR
jgi:predicted outer membrane lipoprotein